MGVSDPYLFEIPFLDLHPSGMVIVRFHRQIHPQSLTRDSHANAIPSRMRRRWRWVKAAPTNNSMAALDNVMHLMSVDVDTIVLDTHTMGPISHSLSWIDAPFITALLEHYSGMVHQYVLFSDSAIPAPFHTIRELKRCFLSYRYTYSRIGSSPKVRVILKESGVCLNKISVMTSVATTAVIMIK